MNPGAATILCLNGGSSSIRFGLYRTAATLVAELQGKVEGVGGRTPVFRYRRAAGGSHEEPWTAACDLATAADLLVAWLERQGLLATVGAVGHRLVHGMSHAEPELITPELLADLRGLQPLDPEHLPSEIRLMEALQRHLPDRPQVACFDTSFHRDLPLVARTLAIPRRFFAKGLRRYGFHGLSYAFLMEELGCLAGSHAAAGRVVLAHLGNGASLAAVHGGRSIDTSMGFTPAGGIPMSTRSGDLDPGVGAYLQRAEQLTEAALDRLTTHESGLLGVSETSGDMGELLRSEAADSRAADAIALFCYQVKKCIGAYAAALGGLDTLVFSGGIGEHASSVRARICDGLQFLGVRLEASANDVNAPVISIPGVPVTVRVIPTDEEQMIARSVCRTLGLSLASEVHP